MPDYASLFRPDLPPAAVRWTGFPPFNLLGGHNDPDGVPIDALVAAAAKVLKREGRTLANYGLESGPLGYKPLREFIARKLAADAGIQCSADQVLITSGSLQGLDLVNAILVAPDDTVLVEEATYGGTISRLKRCGARIIGVPLDDDGLSSRALEKILADEKARGVRPKFVYTIPTVQNPTATVMSDGRRREILQQPESYGVPVFEDDCYADLVWGGARPPAMRGMAGDDRVIYIGSFSKSIAPALRIGYLVADWTVMSRILPIKTDGGTGALEQMVLAEFCRDHFDTHVDSMRKALRRKAEVLMDALESSFGEAAEFDDPAGGIFLWVKLPGSVDTTRLVQAALQSGIAINPGAEWMTDAAAGQRRIRFCFAHPSEQVLREGVARLAEVCRREFGVPAPTGKMHR